jgi:hypothetical protein
MQRSAKGAAADDIRILLRAKRLAPVRWTVLFDHQPFIRFMNRLVHQFASLPTEFAERVPHVERQEKAGSGKQPTEANSEDACKKKEKERNTPCKLGLRFQVLDLWYYGMFALLEFGERFPVLRVSWIIS